MNKSILLAVFCPLLAAAQTVDPAEISARIRQQLERRGMRVADMTRAASEHRKKLQKAETVPMPHMRIESNGAAPDPELVNQLGQTFRRLYAVYQQLGALDSPPDLYLNNEPVINAYAANGSEVHIYSALAELIHDSQSELAFAVGHEMGHIVQQRTAALLFVTDNPEFDADVWGVLTTLLSGYDPYAGSGTLAKLSMVTGDVGLAQQFEDQNSHDAHKSFVSCIEIMYQALRAVCGIDAEFQSLCDQYRDAVHPHFPSGAVL